MTTTLKKKPVKAVYHNASVRGIRNGFLVNISNDLDGFYEESKVMYYPSMKEAVQAINDATAKWS